MKALNLSNETSFTFSHNDYKRAFNYILTYCKNNNLPIAQDSQFNTPKITKGQYSYQMGDWCIPFTSIQTNEYTQGIYTYYDRHNVPVNLPMYSLNGHDIVVVRDGCMLVRVNDSDLEPTIDYWTPTHYDIANHFNLIKG